MVWVGPLVAGASTTPDAGSKLTELYETVLQHLHANANLALVSVAVAIFGGTGAWLMARGALLKLDENFLTATRAEARPGALRVVAGVALAVLGCALLFLPGPGILLILVGAVVAEAPGRTRLMRWAFRKPTLLREINGMRTRHGRLPLRAPTFSSRD